MEQITKSNHLLNIYLDKKTQRIKNYYIWFEQLNKMSDGSVERNGSLEEIKFLFLSNNRVSVFTQMRHWILNQNIAREHFYSQPN